MQPYAQLCLPLLGALLGALIAVGALLPAQAQGPTDTPHQVANLEAPEVRGTQQAEQPPIGQGLQGIASFEVTHFRTPFTNDAYALRNELQEHLAQALRDHPGLPKASPAQGMVWLRCGDDYRCGRLILSVTQGEHGPTLWEQSFNNRSWWSLWGIGAGPGPMDAQRMALRLADALAKAYQHANP
jgi:hypothetical protein